LRGAFFLLDAAAFVGTNRDGALRQQQDRQAEQNAEESKYTHRLFHDFI
jgi:hypothetical protein